MSGFSSSAEAALERKVDISEKQPRAVNIEVTFELEKCAAWITTGGFKRVCLQFPDEYLADATSVAAYLKSATNVDVFILADTSYSSCCVDSVAAAHVAADGLVHFGPSCLSPCSGLPVFYVFPSGQLNIADFQQALRPILVDNLETVIFYETRFHKYLPELKDALNGLPSVSISEIVDPNDKEPGCVCGRRMPETYQQGVFIGSDSMLLTNLALIFKETTWFIYEDNRLKKLSLQQNRFLMKRLHLVEKLKDAEAVGILVGTLSVDGCLEAVDRVKKLCKSAGKKCYTIAVGRPNTAKLANFPEINAFVLVSCPENQLFIDTKEYYQPILSLFEVELALGGRLWSTDYTLDFRQLQPGGVMFSEGVEQPKVEGDVSLVTGKIRQIGIDRDSSEPDNQKALIAKNSGAVVDSHGARFLSTRSWSGLEQKLGETPVEKAAQGRRGIPLAYENEGGAI